MLRIRAIAIIVLLIGVLYSLAPAARKRKWADKLRELAKALAVSMVLYWIYMFAIYFLRPGS